LEFWGVVKLMEGYAGSDNPGAKSQGMKQFIGRRGVALIGHNLATRSFPGLFLKKGRPGPAGRSNEKRLPDRTGRNQ